MARRTIGSFLQLGLRGLKLPNRKKNWSVALGLGWEIGADFVPDLIQARTRILVLVQTGLRLLANKMFKCLVLKSADLRSR